MFLRRIATVVLGGTALLAFQASAAEAATFTPTMSSQIMQVDNGAEVGTTDVRYVGGATVGACHFLVSGPSTSPSSTPFHIAGSVTYTGARTVASTELSCQLRRNGSEVGTLTLQLPGTTSAVAGSIPVTSLGQFEICTMTNVHFTDGTESNPTEIYSCRTIGSV